MTAPAAVVAGLLGVSLLLVPSSVSGIRLRRVLPGTTPITRPYIVPLFRSSRWQLTWLALCTAGLTIAVVGIPQGVVLAVPISGLVVALARRLIMRRTSRISDTAAQLRLALTGDLLGVCLRAGLPIPTAVRVVAGAAPPTAARALRATADLLALGAEPAEAWEPVRQHGPTAELARAAGRTARSGAALADAALALAENVRSTVAEEAEERTQRAAVLITGPLGLCFLPAFLCLGVVPVIIGLADQLNVLI